MAGGRLKTIWLWAAALALPGATAAHQTPPEAPAPRAPAIALTFDDIPAHGPLPTGVTRIDVVDAIIAALKAAKAPAFGFVNGGFGIDDPQSPTVMAHWRAAGFPVGNHSFSHLNLNENGADAFMADVARNEPVIAPLMSGEDWHWLRFPYLAEGDTPAKRDAVRIWLAGQHYKIAAVTASFGDYGWNTVYARCLAKGDAGVIAGLEKSFIDAAREEAIRKRDLSRQLYGRDVPQVLLLHLGAFDARMLVRLLDLYRTLGFRFTTLAEAERDPFYAAAVDPRLPGPSPTFEAAAAARGMTVAAPRFGLPPATSCQ